jgi:hypothetical protein
VKRIHALLLPVLLGLAAGQAQAHAHHKIMGTVKSVSPERLVVTQQDGKDRTIPLARTTMVMRGAEHLGLAQVTPGVRVVVAMAEDDVTAAHIKLGPATAGK